MRVGHPVTPVSGPAGSGVASSWAGLARPWLESDRRFGALALTASLTFAWSAAFHPVAALVTLVLAAAFAVLWARPAALIPILIVLMGNTKVNYYLGWVTVFPEYVVLLLALAAGLLCWMQDGRGLEERGLMLLFAAFFTAGCLSFVNAINLPRVFSKSVLVIVAAIVTYRVATGLRSERDLCRALDWLEGAALAVALFGIAQVAGLILHWDLSLPFLRRWGNPGMEYNIGAPVVRGGLHVYRSNSLFNDPNILGGYLAAAFPVVLALRLHHGTRPDHRLQARLETALLAVLLLCLLLTISRSGMLGAGAGIAIVLAHYPRVAGAPRFWITLGAGLGAILGVSALAGVNPGLIVWRIASIFDPGDLSSSTHFSVALFALSLLARFPLTGVGFNNFGYYYGSELDARMANMMAHNAVLSYFAEGGLLGGLAFLGLALAIGRRPWRALRRPGAARARPALYAATAGLLGALVALLVSNFFYDFSLRTMVWVYAGLAIGAARLWEREPGLDAP